MEELRTRIARTLRREREAASLSVSELARRAGVSKATVSQLESGSGNPSVETLWALGVALGVPFAVLVDQQSNAPKLIRADDLSGVPSSAAAYSATLLSASPPGARRDVYLIQAEPGDARRSDPHHPGTIEHVVLMAGQARIGPAENPVLLDPGDYLTYAGDAPHVFEATVAGTRAVLISELR
ncbi:XRE family transcriptional regulator [Microbacterium oxydans]|jgi:transcriptional regulator with XRE-family HTH domain|uniref:HTH-type transcriptional regulator SutR n=1 Tax=Microbacterium oxydans TaxID=82380 RepID=A0A3S9WM22_9MICO|nr:MULTISPECIES: XRE family transcriptional regulator [Microbacterium]AZS41119.1 HTH-type transcriptional regulator SutR [Microbacterium oxydans]KKX96296.1 DNA-binding protein [Microbacterium sp. Ag1]MBE7953984.1 helix-turn-helix transcriptional regulator [Microbacterium sp. R1]MCB8044867.1 helix-turn-helix transcriptional regulator [Microbacterium oxydans]NYF27690.1 transcriptional regulator with XRE-family HTH domain [Microbacterium sp. JAI119]